jgi:predicted transcriptional regulator
MPAKPLTPEQRADAKRLKAAFVAFQGRMREKGEPVTQETVAEALKFGQSAVSQYLNGGIPLNADALVKFCKLMDEKPEQISPDIYRSELEKSMALANSAATKEVGVKKQYGGEAPMPEDVLSALATASDETRQQVENTVRMMLGLPKSRKQKAA